MKKTYKKMTIAEKRAYWRKINNAAYARKKHNPKWIAHRQKLGKIWAETNYEKAMLLQRRSQLKIKLKFINEILKEKFGCPKG